MEESFRRLAGYAAVVTGIGGFLYSIAFVIVSRSAPSLGAGLSSAFLLAGGLLAAVVIVALYQLFRGASPSFALLGLVFGLAAAVGSAIHGAHDLSIVLHPPARFDADLPSQVDPRGLLTFGVAGLSVLVFAWLIFETGILPRGLAYLGYALALLLVLVYLARLIVLTPTSPLVLGPAALVGFILNPAWYVWLGLALLQGARRGAFALS